MPKVRLLTEKVANQIAAGEVIERPASIVKELVENAIDAQASRIRVEVEAGGRNLIRVVDDGCGMNRDDALMALERHATSKIRDATDLDTITSMGFRGEALPSIASISRFSLTTRERDSEAPEGTRIVVAGGKIVKVQDAVGAAGTGIEVRNVFFNLPARRKFLRTVETERAHIQQYLLTVALAYPQIAFRYLHDHRDIWHLPALEANGSPQRRTECLTRRWRSLNGETGEMLSLQTETSLESNRAADPEADASRTMRLWGLIGSPGVSRSSRADQYFFVNGRPVDNAGLHRALAEGYHTSLMKGRYPVGCLFLQLAPRFVDVNVHPAKREIKFRHEADVRKLISEAVSDRLQRLSLGNVPAPEPPPPAAAEPVSRQATAAWPSPVPAPTFPPAPLPAAPAAPLPPPLPAKPAPLPRSSPAERPPVPLLQTPLKLIGVVARLYVLFESRRGLAVMDQHAAHERVLFERTMKQLETGTVPSQRLLLPEAFELNPRDAQFLKDRLPIFSRLGIGISEFGSASFLLDALPPFVKVTDARRFALEIVDGLQRSGEGVNSLRLGEPFIAKKVCRQAVKANDPLNPQEIERLLRDLRRCDRPYTCPHGRPTLIELTAQELERRFGRSQ